MTYQSKVMTVYILGLFMTIIDGTMVNVALPTMAEDFGVPTTDIEWIAVGYLLSFAAVIPIAGWVGDRFGTKRVFVIARDLRRHVARCGPRHSRSNSS